MALEQFAYLAEIIGVVVVTTSLIYLAKQVRQNNKQLESQSYQAWVASNLQINMSMSDPALSAIIAEGNSDSANLSDKSYVAYAMSHLAIMQMAQAADYLYRSGSLDRHLWEGEMNRAAGILAMPGVRQWWDAAAIRNSLKDLSGKWSLRDRISHIGPGILNAGTFAPRTLRTSRQVYRQALITGNLE